MTIKAQLDRAAVLARTVLDKNRGATAPQISQDACAALAAAVLATAEAAKHIARLEDELKHEKAARQAAEACVDAAPVCYLPASVSHEHHAEHHREHDHQHEL